MTIDRDQHQASVDPDRTRDPRRLRGPRGFGRIFQRGPIFWIAYFIRGQEFRESSKSTRREDAIALLKTRLSDVHTGRWLHPEQARATVQHLCDAYWQDLVFRESKSLRSARSHLLHISDGLGMLRAVDVTTERIATWMQALLDDEYARGTVRTSATYLRAILRHAELNGRIVKVPRLPAFPVRNTRRGFFEPHEVKRLLAALDQPWRDLVRFYYATGWRRLEAQALRWAWVDLAAGVITLPETKNGEGRTLPILDDMRTVLERRWQARHYRRADGVEAIAEFVFHVQGRWVGNWTRRWRRALGACGLDGRLIHDFRRTAARDMVRAGISEAVAMSVTGHRSRSVFTRYNIADARDQAEALRAVARHRELQLAEGGQITDIRRG
jgi:integrase